LDGHNNAVASLRVNPMGEGARWRAAGQEFAGNKLVNLTQPTGMVFLSWDDVDAIIRYEIRDGMVTLTASGNSANGRGANIVLENALPKGRTHEIQMKLGASPVKLGFVARLGNPERNVMVFVGKPSE